MLQQNSGLTVGYRLPHEGGSSTHMDGALLIEGQPLLPVEVRRNLRKQHLRIMLERHQEQQPWLLITDYLSPPMQQFLRDQQVYYLDLAGNTYLRLPGILVSVKGEKAPIDSIGAPERALSDAQIKALFGLLLRPSWVNLSYRQLEPKLQVGKATLSKLYQRLQDENLLVGEPQAFAWPQRQALWDFWTEAYGSQLRHKLLLGRFRFSQQATALPWEQWTLTSDTWFSGEPAAHLLEADLIPGEFTLYTRASAHDLIKRHRVVPDSEGYLTAYRPFWSAHLLSSTTNDARLAPLPLIYADLMLSGKARAQACAQTLLHRHAQPPS